VNPREENNQLNPKNLKLLHAFPSSGTLSEKNFSEDSMTTLSESGKLPLKANELYNDIFI